jgi:hypothetical protein
VQTADYLEENVIVFRQHLLTSGNAAIEAPSIEHIPEFGVEPARGANPAQATSRTGFRQAVQFIRFVKEVQGLPS